MTLRDRTAVIVVTLAAVLGGAWLLVVSPERERASKLNAQIASVKSQLASAQGDVANARSAQGKYAAAYESIVNLGKAVPPSQEVPSLIYQISRATDQKNVDFTSIAAGAAGGSASSSASSSSAPGSSAAGAAPASFTQLPFTFVFEGGFFQLENLFRQLADFTTLSSPGHVNVSGRLLTVQSVKLAPPSGSGSAGSGLLAGTITATAYVLPAGQGLTGAAGAATPTGAATTPASGGASSAPATPAIVKATP